MPDKIAIVQEAHQRLKNEFAKGNDFVTTRDACIQILRDVTVQIPDLWDGGSYGPQKPLRDMLVQDEPQYENWFPALRYAQIEIVHEVEDSRKKKKR